MPTFDFGRRAFLKGCSAIPLIGTTMTAAPFQSQSVPAVKGAGKAVVIPPHEFAGDLDERLEFPPNWDIHVMDMAGPNPPGLPPGGGAAPNTQTSRTGGA